MSRDLVYLHGIGTGSAVFEDHTARFPSSHAWDMPGFAGDPADAFDFETLSARLLGVLDRRGTERAVLFGHSIGGMIAYDFALRHPDRLRGLVLANTTPAFGGRDPSFAEAFVSARLGPLDSGKTMADIARANAAAVVGEGTDPARVDRLAAIMAGVPEAAYRNAIRCLVTFNRHADVERVAAPCLLIAGKDDKAAPLRTMEKMTERLPDADLHILPGGHMTPFEHPGTVADLTAAFLTRLEAS